MSTSRTRRCVLTRDHQVVGDPARFLQARVRHQAVQLLPVHAATRVQGEVDGHGAAFGGPALGLAGQVGVPGELGERAAHGSTDRHHALWLTDRRRREGVHGGDGQSWEDRGGQSQILTFTHKSEQKTSPNHILEPGSVKTALAGVQICYLLKTALTND